MTSDSKNSREQSDKELYEELCKLFDDVTDKPDDILYKPEDITDESADILFISIARENALTEAHQRAHQIRVTKFNRITRILSLGIYGILGGTLGVTIFLEAKELSTRLLVGLITGGFGSWLTGIYNTKRVKNFTIMEYIRSMLYPLGISLGIFGIIYLAIMLFSYGLVGLVNFIGWLIDLIIGAILEFIVKIVKGIFT